MIEVGIGIAGFGIVGGGVLSILRSHAREIEARLGARIVVRKVAVRDPEKERMIDVARPPLTARYQDLVADPSVQVVVELVGGTRVEFPADDAVAPLPEALEEIPRQQALGFTTFVVKPSIFIDRRDAHAAFCREVIQRVAALTS